MATWEDHPLSSQIRGAIQDAHIGILIGAGGSAGLFELLGDVENLITDIEESDEPEKRRQRAVSLVLARFFKGVVQRNALLDSGDGDFVVERYRKLLAEINRLLRARNSTLLHRDVSIYTTNIDTAIELAAERASFEMNDGFSGRYTPKFQADNFGSVRYTRSPRQSRLSEVPTLNLLKVHGSLNWRADQDEEGQDLPLKLDRDLSQIRQIEADHQATIDAVVRRRRRLTPQKFLNQAQDLSSRRASQLDAFREDYEKLAIINPTKAKFGRTVLEEVYYELLRIMANDLERQNCLLFVCGFSCRDEHIMSILSRAVRTNPTLQILVFAYSPEDVEDLSQILEPLASTNGNLSLVGPPPDVEPNEDDEEGSRVRYSLEWFTEHVLHAALPEGETRNMGT